MKNDELKRKDAKIAKKNECIVFFASFASLRFSFLDVREGTG